MARDFKTAWALAQKGQYVPGMFAADDLYGMPRRNNKNQQYSQRTPPRQPYTPRVSAPPKTTPTPVWSEYAGMSSQKRYDYSPTLQKQRKTYAMALFDRAEAILSKAHMAGDW